MLTWDNMTSTEDLAVYTGIEVVDEKQLPETEAFSVVKHIPESFFASETYLLCPRSKETFGQYLDYIQTHGDPEQYLQITTGGEYVPLYSWGRDISSTWDEFHKVPEKVITRSLYIGVELPRTRYESLGAELDVAEQFLTIKVHRLYQNDDCDPDGEVILISPTRSMKFSGYMTFILKHDLYHGYISRYYEHGFSGSHTVLYDIGRKTLALPVDTNNFKRGLEFISVSRKIKRERFAEYVKLLSLFMREHAYIYQVADLHKPGSDIIDYYDPTGESFSWQIVRSNKKDSPSMYGESSDDDEYTIDNFIFKMDSISQSKHGCCQCGVAYPALSLTGKIILQDRQTKHFKADLDTSSYWPCDCDADEVTASIRKDNPCLLYFRFYVDHDHNTWDYLSIGHNLRYSDLSNLMLIVFE